MGRKFYKQTFSFDVYSEDIPLEWDDLPDIARAIDTGDSVGSPLREKCIQITPEQAVKALYAIGSEPGFFQLDDAGREISA